MSLAEANRKYFDSISDAYDSKPWFAKVNQQVTEALQSKLDWIDIPFANTDSSQNAKEVRFLDYACGPGLMSKIYGPYVTVIRGIDISSKMVATYNSRARAAGLPISSVNATVGDLFDKSTPPSPEISGPEYHNFDLAAVGFGFHHFEDVVHASRCLKERLRPGGVLVITDFLEGGDVEADENGNPIEGTEGDHAHRHQHHTEHQQHDHHTHDHQDGHDHQHQASEKGDIRDQPHVRQQMKESIVVYSFSSEGVKKFFTEAGFVDVDVVLMPERSYMEFGGKKLWRRILMAKGRRPFENEKGRSEL